MTTGLPLAGDAAATQSSIVLTALLELRALGETIGESFLEELVELFVKDTEALLVELRGAVEGRDLAAVAGIAHNVNGGAAQFGAQRLSSSCTVLERVATAGHLSRDDTELREVEGDYVELRRILRQQMARWSAHGGDSDE